MREADLELHPGKTRIIYCRDSRRRQRWDGAASFDFLGCAFRPRGTLGKNGKFTVKFPRATRLTPARYSRRSIRLWAASIRPLKGQVQGGYTRGPRSSRWFRRTRPAGIAPGRFPVLPVRRLPCARRRAGGVLWPGLRRRTSCRHQRGVRGMPGAGVTSARPVPSYRASVMPARVAAGTPVAPLSAARSRWPSWQCHSLCRCSSCVVSRSQSTPAQAKMSRWQGEQGGVAFLLPLWPGQAADVPASRRARAQP